MVERARLFPAFPPSPGETATSWVSRLARLHGTSARFFCLDMGVSLSAIALGNDDAIETVARLAGVPIALARSFAIRKVGSSYSLRGQKLTKSGLSRERVRVCPLCLRGDITDISCPPFVAAYGRATWQIAAIRACVVHDVALVKVADASSTTVDDFSVLVEGRVRDIESFAKLAIARPASSLERYLVDRIEVGVKGSRWLDTLEFHVAAKLCEMVGLVALFGRDANVKELNDSQWAGCGEAGFQIVGSGEEGIRGFLVGLQKTFIGDNPASVGPQAVFGAFYRWLGWARDADFDVVRDIVTRHVVETTPLGPEDELFGQPITRRVLHSIVTAAAEIGSHPKQLRKILAATGTIPPSHASLSDALVYFDAKSARAVLDKARGSMMLKEVERYLGAGRVQTRFLMDQKFIVPFVSTEKFGQGGTSHTFARGDIDNFMRRLSENAVPVAEFAPPVYPIQEASKRACCGAGEIIRLILKKRLKWVGRRLDAEGYRSILVRLDEIRPHVVIEFPVAVSINQLAKLWKTTTLAIKALIAAGHLSLVVAKNAKNRCPMNAVPEADIAAFRAKYVPLFELAALHKIHPLKAKRLLAEHGIRPALDRKEFLVTYYNRKEALDAVAAE